MNPASARTEQVYVSRGVRRSLEDMALMHLGDQPEGTEGPSISALADGLADKILREYLDTVPGLAQCGREIGKAVRDIKAKYAQQQS